LHLQTGGEILAPNAQQDLLFQHKLIHATRAKALVAMLPALLALSFAATDSASATVLCTNSNCGIVYPAGTKVSYTLKSGTSVKFTFGGTAVVTCTGSTASGKTSAESGATISSALESLTWTGCSQKTETLKNGSLSIAWTSGSNGSVSSSGTEVSSVVLGSTCVYGTTEGTTLGPLVGSEEPVLTVAATIKKISGGFICPATAGWDAEYVVTEPHALFVGSAGGKEINKEELTGGCNEAAPYLEFCPVVDPVNAMSGNLTEEQTDLALHGRGPALQVTRSYNSQAAVAAKEAGPFGFGWSGPFGAHLVVGKEIATVYQGNGAAAVFYLAGGTYSPAPWVQAGLIKEVVEAKEFYVFTLPDQEKLKFNAEGKLIEVKDRNGNALTLTYAEGKLTAVKDGAGRELKFAYTGAQVTSIEDPLGHKVTYAYEAGNLTSVTLPGEVSPRWKFKYDASHQLTEMTDARGHTTKNEFDEKNRVKTQTDRLERKTKFEYGEAGNRKTTTITEPNASTTFYKFNEAGEPLELIEAKGTSLERKTTNEYSASFELNKSTDPKSHATTYEYDAEGNRTLEKDAESDERKWTYNKTHDVETETTPKGEKTTFKRDAHGNVEAIERPAPGETTQKTTFKHAANGDLESETDPLGHETKFEYDTYGNRKAEIDAAGDKRSWTYDKDGRIEAEVSPRGNEEGAEAAKFTTKFERDAQGRPIKVTDPLAHETKYGYDANGNLETLTDANAHVTKYTYDSDDERTKVERGNGTTTETAYDSMGKVKSKTNGNGKTTKYERNALEQITEVIDPLERKTTREYDAAGNLEKQKDPEGRTTTYSYDNTDRLTKASYSEEATHAVEFEYDKDSNVTVMKDGTGTTKTTYDVLDRPTEVENGNKELVKYEYNLGNLTTKITYPNSKAVTREFDSANRLKKVTDWLSHSTTFGYDRDSNLKTTTFPTTVVDEDSAEYNAADQLSKQTFKKGAETLASLTYTRDKIGQLESTAQTGLPGKATTAYEYDKGNRLTKGGETAFGYDNAGNPTKIGATELKYDAASQLEKFGTTAYSFDKLGERTKAAPEKGPATSYAFDQAGNLTSAKRSAEGEISKIEDAYAYDGNGFRQSETISGVTNHLAWDTTLSLPLLLYDGTQYYVYGPEGVPVEQIAAETPTYLHHDQQGSTRLLTSQAGTVSGSYTFTPYGQTEAHTGTATTPLGYDGQYTSSDTGLIYLRARVYDPATAQFMSVDPLMEETGETYGFAESNPVNQWDPDGQQPPPPTPEQPPQPEPRPPYVPSMFPLRSLLNPDRPLYQFDSFARENPFLRILKKGGCVLLPAQPPNFPGIGVFKYEGLHWEFGFGLHGMPKDWRDPFHNIHGEAHGWLLFSW
jgi:RHS repeat-associated protein